VILNASVGLRARTSWKSALRVARRRSNGCAWAFGDRRKALLCEWVCRILQHCVHSLSVRVPVSAVADATVAHSILCSGSAGLRWAERRDHYWSTPGYLSRGTVRAAASVRRMLRCAVAVMRHSVTRQGVRWRRLFSTCMSQNVFACVDAVRRTGKISEISPKYLRRQ
jgi:hypothetical protein